ncbi:hypothetical protein AMR41_27790 [Hapalosiphon sp. MRB220]|nr:hypothetical protein AMR41_27790 [Hapalosiphon sp. MRB220]
MANRHVINLDSGNYNEYIQGDYIQIGSVIQLVNPSQEAIDQLRQIAKIPTEVQPSLVSETESQQELKTIQNNLDEILNVVKGLEQQGEHLKEIRADKLKISRVDVLIKKAVLLKTEAEQLFFDQLERHKSKIEQAKAQAIGDTFQLDLNDILVGFDSAAHTAKLKQSLKLLREANELEPSNTEVLLHMAQALGQLTPDEPYEMRKILYRVLNLLHEPISDIDKFRQAQATFLLATSGNNTHVDLLHDARAIFEQIGRTEWVRQCDILLHDNHKVSEKYPLEISDSIQFQPIGQWLLQVTDGSMMQAIFYPNGTFQGIQLAGLLGSNIPFTGQWAFIPQTQILQVQGLISGWQPYMLVIAIQSIKDNKFYGTGNDGRGYIFSRV